ncbi:MAG: site-2 protease family protein [Actinomycetia bacterium]|nr:site-2 protease family protein [Actinomycetes bacterium]
MTHTPQPARQPSPAQTSTERLSGISLGTPFGVPLRLSASWFLGAAIIAWVFGPLVERWLLLQPPWTYVVGASFAVLLGLSVLAHEMAHAVMAQRFGLRVRSMTIHLLGGVTTMEAETRRPWVDFTIAVVGPLTSLLVAALAGLGYLVAPDGTVFAFVTWQLMAANLVVGVLNLVPALPLDGGRLLRDVVWAASGREHVGTLVAGWTGRAFAVLVAFLAILPVLLGRPDFVWLSWGLLLAGFIWLEASRSLKYVGVSRAITGLRVADLVRPAVFVPHDTPLATALQRVADTRAALVVTDANGDVGGVVLSESALAVPEDRRPWVPVSSVAVTVTHVGRVSPDASGQELVEVLNSVPAAMHLVEDDRGTVYGVLITADVEETLASRTA